MRRTFLLKSMLLLCALVAGMSSAWGETTTIASWGKVSFAKDTGVQASGGDLNNKGIATITIDKALTTAGTSTSNCYYGSSAGGATIVISDLDLSGYTGISMTFYARASQSGKFTITTSANGTSWSDLSEVTLSGTEGQKTVNSILSSAKYIKLVHDKTSGSLYFGTVVISGTAVSKTNTSLSLSPNPLNLSYGGSTGTLTATVTPEGESALANPTISWESDNENVATVSDGTVTPVGEGSCTITATYAGDDDYNGSSNTATVNVTDTRTAVVSAITSINSLKSLYIGGKHAFTPVVTLADGLSESDVTYSYVSADPATIQINDDGTYTALKTGTNIEITVTVSPIAAKAATYKPVSATFQHNGAYKYSKPVFTPTGVTEGNFSGSMTLAMANDGTPTGPIYYTLDGEEPATDKSNGTLYSEELTLTATKTVKARVIDEDGYYSTVTSATYTRVPANKDAISLAAGESLSFTDFSGIGAYTANVTNNVKTVYISSSDGDKYKWTGIDFGTYDSGKTVQLKSTTGYMTSVAITSPNGFKMTISYSGSGASVAVLVGEETQTAKDGAYTFPTGTTVTLKRSGGTPAISNITFTGLKEPVATEVAITDPGTLAKGTTGTFAYTKTTEESGTKAWTSSNASVIEIKDAATGAYEAKGRGSAKITLTITPTDASAYEVASAELNVNVTEPVVITASDVEMTYGDDAKAIGATTSTGYAGTLTYESGNTSIATVDATGKVTAVAAGSTTITISAPADAANLYTAGEDKVINVTVSAPEGVEETPSGTAVQLYKRLETGGTGLPANWTADADNMWSYDSSYGAVAGASTSGNGTTGTSYDLVTEDFDLSGYVTPFVYFSHVANKVSTNKSTVCKLFVQEGDNDPVQLTIPNWFGGSNWTFVNSGNIDLTAYFGKTVHFIFRYTPSGTNADGKWEVKDFTIKAYNNQTVDVTVAVSGYGSYCCEYPIDLDQLDANVKAYTVTNVESSTVTFTNITGKIKGGVPFILYGTSGPHTLTLADESTTVPAGNKLVGTLAPTYITTVNGEYTNFGLSGGKFVKINEGTLPANKAYLPVLTANIPTSAPTFTIVFDDATGISRVESVQMVNDQYYDLQGRKVAQPTKGLYIVNGRKVVVK